MDKNLYVGTRNDIARRLTEHNSGKVDSMKSRTPFTLEAYFALRHKSSATELEWYLKSGSGRVFVRKRIL